jgi:hypothetical protein
VATKDRAVQPELHRFVAKDRQGMPNRDQSMKRKFHSLRRHGLLRTPAGTALPFPLWVRVSGLRESTLQPAHLRMFDVSTSHGRRIPCARS